VPVRRCNKSAGAPSPRISCKAWWGQRSLMRLSLSKAAHADMAGGRAVGNPGSFALFAKGGIPRILMHTVAYPTLFSGEHCPLQRVDATSATSTVFWRNDLQNRNFFVRWWSRIKFSAMRFSHVCTLHSPQEICARAICLQEGVLDDGLGKIPIANRKSRKRSRRERYW